MRQGGNNHGRSPWTSPMSFWASTRALALLLAAVAFCAPLFTAWHDAMVQHVRCAEHGELTHVNALHSHNGKAGGARSSLQTEENTNLSDVDRHCGVAFVLRGGAPAPVVQSVAGYQPPPAPVGPVDFVVPRARLFVLASAPKTSPPAA